ncbi:MAG TPA: lytic transglycosylase domain-containing protein [Fimbriimonadaceae bacterium]
MNPINGLLGPEGVQQRMQEIQQKLDALNGPSFNSYLGKPSPLQGQIGAGGSTAPFNPMGPGVGITSKASPELKNMIAQAAQQNGVDPNLLDALVATESSYDPSARSHTGAMGLCQLMPGTAQQMGISNPLDPSQNLNGGAKYLSGLLKQFGSAPLALAAYNAGPNAVLKAGNQIPNYPETQNYVQRIMDLVNSKKGQ